MILIKFNNLRFDIMKTIFFLLVTFWTLNSYGQNNKINGLLEKPETRTEIFNAIMNNHELMMEFMQSMKQNDHAMMMMQENNMMSHDGNMMMNNQMMGHNMMSHDPKLMGQMVSVYMNDSVACEQLTDSIMTHRGMMNMMMRKMYKNGMLDQNEVQKVHNMMMNKSDFDKVKHMH